MRSRRRSAAVDRRELIEVDDAVGDAVHGAVGGLGREIIEHDDGGIVLGEIMLERQDLAAIAQRALRQQPDFRQAVDDDALRLQAFDGIEDALDGFAKFEIGRIEQALVLVGIEHAFRRHQFENLDLRSDGPAVRTRAVAQFVLGFGEADIDPGLAGRGAGQQKLQRDRGLAGPGLPSSRCSRLRARPPSSTSSSTGRRRSKPAADRVSSRP